MELIKVSLAILFVAVLSGCDQKIASIEETKRYYDSMSDDKIKERYKLKVLSSCKNEIEKMPSSVKGQFNIEDVCYCFAEKYIEFTDIKTLRLELLPKEALSSEQIKSIQNKTENIMRKIIIPQCFSRK